MGPGRGREPGEGLDRLVVVAATGEALADQPGQPGAGDRGHGDLAELVTAGAVLLVVHDVRGVLVEGATAVHGHQLHPAADAQHRKVEGVRGVQQGQPPRRRGPVASCWCAGAARRRTAPGRRPPHR